MFKSGEHSESRSLPDGTSHQSPLDGNSGPPAPSEKTTEGTGLLGDIFEREEWPRQDEMTTSKRKRPEDSPAADDLAKKPRPTEGLEQTDQINSNALEAEAGAISTPLENHEWESTDIQALVKPTLTDYPLEKMTEFFLPKPLQTLHRQICESSSLIAYVEKLEKTITQLRKELENPEQNATMSTKDRQHEKTETEKSETGLLQMMETEQHQVVETGQQQENESSKEEGSETGAEQQLDIRMVCITKPAKLFRGDLVFKYLIFRIFN